MFAFHYFILGEGAVRKEGSEERVILIIVEKRFWPQSRRYMVSSWDKVREGFGYFLN